MSLLLLPIVEVYRLILQPVAPFTWFGVQLSTLDVVAAFRLCVALRQIREKLRQDHIVKLKTVQASEKEKAVTIPEVEERSFVRDAAAALLVVYGGEAVMGPSPFLSSTLKFAHRLYACQLRPWRSLRLSCTPEWYRRSTPPSRLQ